MGGLLTVTRTIVGKVLVENANLWQANGIYCVELYALDSFAKYMFAIAAFQM